MPEMGENAMTDTETGGAENVETTEATSENESGPIVLPDDHPLVKTLAAQKELIKELKAKAGRVDELEDSSKTELQKLTERLEAAEKRANEVAAEKLRSDVARVKGVPVELLTGSDEETLNAQADALLAFKGNPPSAPSSDGQGKTGAAVSGRGSTADVFAGFIESQLN